MDPILIQIGPLTIRWYGFLLTLAIFVAFELAKRRIKAWGLDAERFEAAAFWAVVFGVVGARLFYVLTSWKEFAPNPVSALYIWQGGLSFHGAVLFGALVFYYYHRRYGLPLYPYLDAATPGVALGIVAGRIGNLMNGSPPCPSASPGRSGPGAFRGSAWGSRTSARSTGVRPWCGGRST